MNEYYQDLPTSNIIQAYKLYEQFKAAESSIEMKESNEIQGLSTNEKISKTFILMQKKNGLELVKKRTIQTTWKRITRGKSFKLSENIQTAASIITHASAADDLHFELAADQIRTVENKITVEQIKNALSELSEYLKIIRDNAQSSLKNREITIAEIPNFEPPKEYFEELNRDRESIKEILKKEIPEIEDLSEAQLEDISIFLISYSDASKFLSFLQENHKPEEKKLALYHLLCKALTLASEEKVDAWFEVIKKFQPELSREREKLVSLKNFALVFGDSFIKESGLEGDITSKTYADLIVKYLDSLPSQTPSTKKIRNILHNGVGLLESDLNTATKLRSKIIQTVAKDNKCVIYGGWIGHAIVYEIEKQKNGKYSFRIYNLGEGIEFHKLTQSQYRTKAEGCVAIKDIPKKLMFKKSFLGSLSSLNRMPSDNIQGMSPQELLYMHLLPSLDGKEELVSSRVKNCLSPQRSGTCPYRSLQALVANTLPKEEYAYFKFDFKMFLLNQYLPELKKNTIELESTTIEELKSTQDSKIEIKNEIKNAIKQINNYAENFINIIDKDNDQAKNLLENLIRDLEILDLIEKEEPTTEDLLNYLDVIKDFSIKLTTAIFEISFHQEYKGINVKFIENPQSLDNNLKVLLSDINNLKKRLDNEVINKEKKMEDSRLEYFLIKKSLEKFSSGFKNLQRIIPESKLKIAESIIDEYKVELVALEKAILENERKIYEIKTSNLQATKPLMIRSEPIKSESLSSPTDFGSFPLIPSLKLCMEMIDAIPSSDNPLFSEKVEDCLVEIAKLKDSNHDINEDFIYAELLKKVSFPNWQTIHYNNPSLALKNLNVILNTISMGIGTGNFGNTDEVAQQHAIYFSMCYAIENAFKQCDHSALIPDNFQSMVNLSSYDFLSRLQSSDPFFIFYLEEIKNHILNFGGNSDYFPWANLAPSPYTKPSLPLNESMTNAIYRWWESEENNDLRLKVEESIKNDREEQEKEIKELSKVTKDKIEELKVEKNKVKKLTKNLENKEKIKKYRNEISELELQLSQIEKAVRENPKYWPEGFESPNCSLQYKTSFFFGKQDFIKEKIGVSLFPEEYKIFYTAMIDCRNSIYKVEFLEKTPELSDLLKITVKPNEITFSCKTFNEYSILQKVNNRYLKNIKKLAPVYNQLFSGEISETNIPKTEQSFSQNRGILLKSDELRELFSLRSSPDIQIASTLNYFSENYELLSDNEWLNIFHALLFDSNLLLKELENDTQREHLIQQFRDFFDNVIVSFIQLDDYKSAANVCWIASNVQNFLDFTSESRKQKELPPINSESVLNKKLLFTIFEKGMDSKFSSQRDELIDSIFASFRNFFDYPPSTEEDKKFFIYGQLANIFRNSEHAKAKNRCQPREDDIEYANFQVRRTLTTDPPILSKEEICDLLNEHGTSLLSKIFPELTDVVFEAEGTDSFKAFDKITRNEIGTIYLTRATFVPKNPQFLKVYDKEISKKIEKHLINNKVFPKDFDFSKMKCYEEKGITYISYPEKKLLLKIDSSATYIKKINESEWCIFISSKSSYWKEIIEKESSFYNYELKEKFKCLQRDNEIYLCDSESFTPIYQSSASQTDQIDQGLKRISDGLYCVKAPENSPFSSFESPNCTIFLANGLGEIQEIQFTRLGITLKRETYGDKVSWKFVEQEGWELANEQFVPHFGQSTGFLVFQNKEKPEQKKVLLPVWNPIESRKMSLNFPYLYNFDSQNTRHGKFVEFGISKNRLVPKSLEGRFYLARIYLEKGYTDDAEDLLFAHESISTHRKLTSEETSILEKIIYSQTSKSNASRNLVLRLRALYIIEKNKKQFPKEQVDDASTEEIKEENLEQIKIKLRLVNEYLGRINHIRPLPQTEELLILRNLLEQVKKRNNKEKKQLDITKITRRINDLDGTNVGDRFIEQQNFETTGKFILSQKSVILEPKLKAKISYWFHRKAKTFPFDPTRVSQDNFLSYESLINQECDRVRNWKDASNSGLVQTLYCMAYFSEHEEIRNRAKHLLNKIDNRLGSERLAVAQRRLNEPSLQSSKAEQQNNVIYIKRELPAIQMIEEISEERANFSKEKASEYLNSEPTLKHGSTDLFEDTCVERIDETTKNKFENTRQDTEIARDKLVDTKYSIKGKPKKSLNALREDLSFQLTQEKNNLEHQEHIILTSVYTALTSNPASNAEFISKKRSLPSITDLCIACAKKNSDEYIQAIYPELSEEGRKTLQIGITNYLIQKKLVQLLDRSIGNVDALLIAIKEKADQETIQDLTNALGKGLTAKSYDVREEHANVFLLIETLENIQLREDQITNIKTFIENFNNRQGVALQIIMGGGKTDIFQPILAFLFADPKTLSVIDIPEHMLKTVIDKLVDKLGSGFKQYVYTMPYDRLRAKDPDYLKNFLKEITEAKQRGACFVRPPKLKHSIITSLYEAYAQNNDERINLIGKIIHFLETNEIVQFEEIDFTMNPQVIFKYSLGSSRIVDKNRASLLSELLIDIASDTKLSEEVSVSFIDGFQKRGGERTEAKGIGISEDLYKNVVKPKLTMIALNRLQKKIPSLNDVIEKDENNYIRNFITQSTPFDNKIETMTKEEEVQLTQYFNFTCPKKEQLEEFLSNPENENKTNEKLIANKLLYKIKTIEFINEQILDIEHKNLLGVCADAIDNIFRTSFLRDCGTQYGPQLKDGKPIPGKYVACPYAAANAPKVTIYSDCYEEVIYSTQNLLYYGIPLDASVRMIQNIQKNIKDEIISGIRLTDTEAYKNLKEIVGPELSQFHVLQEPPPDELISIFQRHASTHKKTLLEFLNTYVYNDIRFYETSISSTPQSLGKSSHLAFGYTGTMHEGILPSSMKGISEKGTDGKTILAVESKMENKISKTETLSEKDGPFPKQIINEFLKDPELFVYIDSGGWLKDENIDDYALQLLKECEKGRTEIKSIVYHTKKGDDYEIVSFEKDLATGEYVKVPFKDSSYKTTDGTAITLIGQNFEFATDIRQKATAKAKMSIRKNMTKRDALQSIFRMRQILYGQSVDFWISPEVKNEIHSGIVNGCRNLDGFNKYIQNPDNFTDFDIFVDKLNIQEKLKIALKTAYGDYKQIANLDQKTLREHSNEFFKCFTRYYEIDSKDIWRYFTVNEAKLEQEKNWIAGKQKMREVIEGPIRSLLADKNIDIKDRKTIFQKFQGLWIEKTDDNPFAKYAKAREELIDSETAIVNEINYFKSFINKISSLNVNLETKYALEDNVRKINPEIEGNTSQEILEKALNNCVKKEDIAPFINNSRSSIGQEKEQELTKEQENQKQLELEDQNQIELENQKQQEREIEIKTQKDTLTEKEYTDLVGKYGLQNAYLVKEFFDKKFNSVSSLIQNFPKALKDAANIEYSPNLFIDDAQLDSDEHGNYHLAGRYLLALKDEKGTRYILVSHEDAGKIKEGMNGKNLPEGKALVLLNLDGSIIASTPHEAEKQFSKNKLKEVLLQCKICTGRSYFTLSEIDLLSKMDKDSQNLAETRKLYENVIKFLPKTTERYKGSRLQKFFIRAKAA